MARKSFVKGAAILGAAGLLVKVLGALFRIPLGNMVSESAMAYYQPAYYIYTFFVVIATSGIPVAISRMVSERITVDNYGEAHRIFKISMKLMLCIGSVAFVILFFGAGPLSQIMNSPNAKYPMMVIAPALILVPTMAAYRGYFQGMQNMKPTAVSQVIEQVFRVAVGLTLAYILYRSSESVLGWISTNAEEASDIKGAMGAISGATVGSVAGLVIIFIIYKMSKKAIYHRIDKCSNYERESSKVILKRILWIAIPITIGASVMPIMNLTEVPIINSRLLGSGYSVEDADFLYGILSGYVTSLINLPQVLTAALAMSLVPLIASVYKEGDIKLLKYNTSLSMRVAMMIGLPCAFGMATLAKPIMLLLYPTKPQIADIAADCLAIMAIGIIFLSITQTLTAILQGVGKQMIPVINLFVAIIIKIVLTYAFVGIHDLNIKGAAIGTVVAYLVASILDIIAVRKYTGVHFEVMLCYVKPAISAALMGAVALLVYKLITLILGTGLAVSGIATIISIGVAAIVYLVLLFVTKSITKDDLENIPKGDKIIRLMEKFGK